MIHEKKKIFQNRGKYVDLSDI